MKFTLELHLDAESEFAESVLWYEKRREGLGYEFLYAIEKKLKLITEKPEIFPYDEFPIRKVILKKFPFTIFYEFNAASKQIYVIGIFHSERNPEVLRRRV